MFLVRLRLRDVAVLRAGWGVAVGVMEEGAGLSGMFGDGRRGWAVLSDGALFHRALLELDAVRPLLSWEDDDDPYPDFDTLLKDKLHYCWAVGKGDSSITDRGYLNIKELLGAA